MILRTLALLAALMAAEALPAQEALAVVVHPESGVTQLSKEEVTNLFLGRQRRLSNGLQALPLDLAKPPETWGRFYKLLVNKELAEINAYWSRLFFSGQAQPPRRLQSSQEIIDFVAANKGAIGFVEKSKVDKRVRVAFLLGAS